MGERKRRVPDSSCEESGDEAGPPIQASSIGSQRNRAKRVCSFKRSSENAPNMPSNQPSPPPQNNNRVQEAEGDALVDDGAPSGGGASSGEGASAGGGALDEDVEVPAEVPNGTGEISHQVLREEFDREVHPAQQFRDDVNDIGNQTGNGVAPLVDIQHDHDFPGSDNYQLPRAQESGLGEDDMEDSDEDEAVGDHHDDVDDGPFYPVVGGENPERPAGGDQHRMVLNEQTITVQTQNKQREVGEGGNQIGIAISQSCNHGVDVGQEKKKYPEDGADDTENQNKDTTPEASDQIEKVQFNNPPLHNIFFARLQESLQKQLHGEEFDAVLEEINEFMKRSETQVTIAQEISECFHYNISLALAESKEDQPHIGSQSFLVATMAEFDNLENEELKTIMLRTVDSLMLTNKLIISLPRLFAALRKIMEELGLLMRLRSGN